MKYVFSMFLALFCAVVTVNAAELEWDLDSTLQFVKAYQEEKDAESVYLSNFIGGFIKGFILTAPQRPLTVEEVDKVANIVDRFVGDKLVLQLKRDGVYEDWVKSQLDPDLPKLTAELFASSTQKDLSREIKRQREWLKKNHTRLFEVTDKDPVYAGLMLQLYGEIQKVFLGKEVK